MNDDLGHGRCAIRRAVPLMVTEAVSCRIAMGRADARAIMRRGLDEKRQKGYEKGDGAHFGLVSGVIALYQTRTSKRSIKTLKLKEREM